MPHAITTIDKSVVTSYNRRDFEEICNLYALQIYHGTAISPRSDTPVLIVGECTRLRNTTSYYQGRETGRLPRVLRYTARLHRRARARSLSRTPSCVVHWRFPIYRHTQPVQGVRENDFARPPTVARAARLRRLPDRREADGRVVVARGEGPGQHGGRRHEGVRHPRGGDPLLRRAPPRLAVTHPCQRARTNAPQMQFAMGNVDRDLAAPGVGPDRRGGRGVVPAPARARGRRGRHLRRRPAQRGRSVPAHAPRRQPQLPRIGQSWEGEGVSGLQRWLRAKDGRVRRCPP